MPRSRGPGSGYEVHVARILLSKGYHIERNVKRKYGELDVVAYKNGRKYLFEVKHRPNSPITRSDVIKLARKAAKLKAIPILAVSTSTGFYETATREAKKRKVRVVRVHYKIQDWV